MGQTAPVCSFVLCGGGCAELHYTSCTSGSHPASDCKGVWPQPITRKSHVVVDRFAETLSNGAYKIVRSTVRIPQETVGKQNAGAFKQQAYDAYCRRPSRRSAMLLQV